MEEQYHDIETYGDEYLEEQASQQRQWRNIRRLNLAQMKDGGYAFALTSESNTGVPNVDRFLSRKKTKEEGL